MSKIKHYDSTLKKWVVDGASNASNIELSNAGYVDDKGNSISVDEGFTKVYNKLMKHENNLAWVYLNGAKGGGGGSGSSDSYTLTVKEGNTVYEVLKVIVTKDRPVGEGSAAGQEGIEVYIVADLRYGENLPDKAEAFQKEVAEKIEEMTAFNVNRVDIEIRDII